MTFSKKFAAFVDRYTFALAALALIVLTYAPLIFALGFYWDDWRVIFHLQSGRLLEMVEFYSYDRPFSAWTVLLFGPILGASILRWQIFSLVLRLSLTLTMAWSLGLVWQRHRRAIVWAALLFSVYPLYFQQPISVAFSQHLIAYILFFVSLGAMLRAIRQPEKFWRFTLLALITQLAHMVTVEHFTGLELLRPVFIFIVIKDLAKPGIRTLREVLRVWFPYLLVLVLFTLWRLLWLELPGEPHALTLLIDMQANFPKALLALSQEILQGLVHVLGSTWYRTLNPELFDTGNIVKLFSLFVGAIAGIGLYLWSKRKLGDEKNVQGAFANWIWIAVLSVLLGLLPIWLIGEQIIETGYNEHLALPALFGAAIFWVGLIFTLVEKPRHQNLVMVVLIGLAVAGQLRVANELRNDWQAQQNLYHQLSWRAPAIKPNTALVSFERLSPYMQNSSVSAALNTLYPQSQAHPNLDYWNFELNFSDNINRLENGQQLTATDRNLQFVAEDSDSNVLYFFPETGCLWVLTPIDANNLFVPQETRALAALSNTDRILNEGGEGAVTETSIFGKTNSNTWCYFFQKAELARQFADWEEVISYYDKAFEADLEPNNAIEFLALVDAYAHLGNWELALEFSEEIASRHAINHPMICALWEEIASNDANGTPANILLEINQFADCEQ